MPKTPEKKPRRISQKYLENAALYYLQRYASSSQNLRRVLMRKIKRSCTFYEEDAAEFEPVVDALIARYIASGLLNDILYAEGRAAGLRRQGRSQKAIAMKLQTKGLSQEDIAEAIVRVDLAADDGSGEEPEYRAALELVRRKKIGALRKTAAEDEEMRRKTLQKDMAVMARAGFSYDIAKRALGGSDSDPAEEDG